MNPGITGLPTPLFQLATSTALTSEVKVYLEHHRAALHQLIQIDQPGSGGEALGARYAKVMDGLLLALFAALSCQHGFGLSHPAPLTLAAVGSYGRGAVALGSDLDVRFLCNGPASRVTSFAESMLYPLWDAGLAVGHQIVAPEELLALARTDLPTATAILDWRFLSGDENLSQALLQRARAGVFCDAEVGGFIQRLAEEVQGRHERFGGSVYLLEPDVKNGAGGLRDLDVAWWAARARWNVNDLSDLVRVGVLVPREAHTIAVAREALWRIRNRLHRASGRRTDRLSFDQQELLAVELGYGEGGAAVESFMSDHYRNARELARAREIIFHRANPVVHRKKPREYDLGRGLRLFDGQVSIGNAAQLAQDPALALRLYQVAVERNLRAYPFARDAIARASQDTKFAEALRDSSEAAETFVSLCTCAQEANLPRGSILAELHDVGLLTAMVPEFSPVVGRVHHDIYHVYTVDIHSIAALDRLRALARGDLAQEHPLACRLAAEISRPTVLYLATLLHDVGKCIGGKDHANRGAVMVRTIGARLRLEPPDTDLIAHLIQTHLLMYHVATRRDLDDPTTIQEFVREVRGREGLRELYLLTVADLSTTSPTAMTSWKAHMLDALYIAADRFLAGPQPSLAPPAGEPFTHDPHVEALCKEVLQRTREQTFALQFLRSMPERYLLSNTPASIAAHLEVSWRAQNGEPRVALIPSERNGFAELCVVAPDRPGLLALIAAALTASRLEIHAAQIHSHALDNGSLQAVDLFWVRSPGIEPDRISRLVSHLEQDLTALLTGAKTAEDLIGGRGRTRGSNRPSPAVQTTISVDDHASSRHTVIEVLTRDARGLVFTLAHTLHELGLSISLAKINTEGAQVADVFYVTEADGAKVQPGPRTAAIRQGLLQALERLREQDK